MADTYSVQPVAGPITGTARPPGSKSITNRALIIAALAKGRSHLTGVLDSTDTRVMVDSLEKMGIDIIHDTEACTADIVGCAGNPPAKEARLWLENSGTSIRFLTAFTTLGHGVYRLDGNNRMQQRPIQPLVDSLNQLGAVAVCEAGTGCPPVVVKGNGLPGGRAEIDSHLSSQFLSALLMAAPCATGAVHLQIPGELVSQPYVEMTLGVMARFGIALDMSHQGLFDIQPGNYKGTNYLIEPDASAASYFFAAAAITGGRVTVEGLSTYALQGDVAFVDILEKMGCRVDREANSITVSGRPLRGVDVDMNAISDTAQTLAAVAVFASSPTRIRNVGHMRHKETDRIAAVVTELRRLGLQAEDHDDGLTIHPGTPQPGVVATYDDHRMAMSFALLGLRHPGIQIADPGCTAKTYPHFFDDLERLCGLKG